MHMTGGEIFTRAQEVTECFVSVGNDDVSTVIDRYRSTFESSLGAFSGLEFDGGTAAICRRALLTGRDAL